MHYPSPNFGPRRGTDRPALIVIHYTAMESCQAAYDRLCLAEAEVSAHWLISVQGQAHQLVDEAARAWHAGAGAWGGQGDVNSRSIGIELDNIGSVPFSAPQMNALEDLLRGIMARWDIPAHGVIGHSDMAPIRKIDPGPRFDWQRLARLGLSVWPRAGVTAEPAAFRQAALAFGYPDVEDDALLSAFRLRFRPHHSGPLDAVDAGMACDLADRFAMPQSAA